MSINSLAIFGDSYGSSEPQKPWSWVEQIKKKYSKVDVYSEGGASLGWIYSTFLKHHINYDKVIFLFTSGFRLYFPFEYTLKKNNKRVKACHWGGLADVLIVEQEACNYDKNLLNFLKQYFVNLSIEVDISTNALPDDHNLMHEHHLNSAVVDSIKKIRPDCILIPCFNCYWKYTKEQYANLFSPYQWSLFDISESENLNFEYPMKDQRANHLSPANHEWLLNHMIKRLEFNVVEDWKNPNVD